MTEQSCCALCGAAGHLAAQCNWNRRRLTFTLESLAAALNDVQCLSDLGPELIAASVFRQHTEQAEGAQGDLWAVHAKGPDDLYAAFSREDAEKHAAELNALPMPEGIAVSAVVVASPWPAAEHWKYLAEQEREHNGALVAQAGQVPEGYMLITQDQVERHATTAWECPPQSRVVLVSTLKRLHEKNGTAPQTIGGK